MSPAQAVYIDDMPEPAGTLHGCLGLSARSPTAEIARIDLRAVRARAGRRRRADRRRTCPAKTTSARPAGTTSRCFADGKVEFYGQPIFAVDRRDARGGARAPRGWPRSRYKELPAVIDVARRSTPARTAGHAAAEARSAAMSPPRSRRRRAGSKARCASAARSISTSKAISPGHSRRGRATSPSIPRPSIRAKCSTWWRMCSACRACRDGRDPAHGRRLRRQGDAGQPVCRARRDRREEAAGAR